MGNSENRPSIVLVNRAFIVHEGKVLLIQRAHNDRWNNDKWEVPGGKLDRGQDVKIALKREIVEECGLEVEITNPLVCFDSKLLTEGPYAGLPYVVLFGIARAQNNDVYLSEEHQDKKWPTLEEVEDYDLTEETRKAFGVLSPLLIKEIANSK